MERIGYILVRRPGPALAAIGVVTLVALAGLSRIGIDESLREFLRAADDHTARFDAISRDFGADDNECIIVFEAQALFSDVAVSALRGMVAAARELDHVEAVYSLDDVIVFDDRGPSRRLLPPPGAPAADFEQARAAALHHPLAAGQLVGTDGRTSVVLVRLARDLSNVSDLTPVISELRRVVLEHIAGTNIAARLTGVPVIRVEMFNLIRRESMRSMLSGALIAAAMGLLLFRRVSAVALTIGGPIVGMIWTLGAMGLVGERANLMNAVLPSLVLMIGFTDAVHLVYEVRRERAAGSIQPEAARLALTRLWVACGLTSLTTAVGFGSLAAARIELIQRFGLACAAGTVLTFFAVIVVVPALASTRLGRNIRSSERSAFSIWIENRAMAALHGIMDHATVVAAMGVVVTAGLAATALMLRPDSYLTEAVPHNSEATLALKHCDRVFGGSVPGCVLVEWNAGEALKTGLVLDAMEDIQRLLAAEPMSAAPLSVVDILETLPAAREGSAAMRAGLLSFLPPELSGRFLNVESRRGLVKFRVADVGTAAYAPVLARLQEQLDELAGRYRGMRFDLAGTSVLAVSTINGMIADLGRSLTMACVVILGVMALALRSLRLGAACVIPNIFPLAVLTAVLAVTGLNLQLTSITVFTVALGLAVDDTIHFLTRFKRERAAGLDVREAIERSFRAVGAAMVTTTVVLCLGFTTSMISPIPVIRLFAWLICLALLAALIGDLVMLPALLVVLDGRRAANRAVARSR